MQPPNAAPSVPAGPTSAPTSFDPIAEMEDKRNRKEKRERQLENLKANRSSKRINVYLTLGILTLLFGFSFFPLSQGDISSNPHESLSSEEVTSWMDPTSPLHWTQEQIDERAESKVWDGRDFNAGSFEQELNVWEEQVRAAQSQIDLSCEEISYLPIGGTAIGTGINAPTKFDKVFCKYLNKITKDNYKPALNKYEALSSHDPLVNFSNSLKTLSVSLLKIINDI